MSTTALNPLRGNGNGYTSPFLFISDICVEISNKLTIRAKQSKSLIGRASCTALIVPFKTIQVTGSIIQWSFGITHKVLSYNNSYNTFSNFANRHRLRFHKEMQLCAGDNQQRDLAYLIPRLYRFIRVNYNLMKLYISTSIQKTVEVINNSTIVAAYCEDIHPELITAQKAICNTAANCLRATKKTYIDFLGCKPCHDIDAVSLRDILFYHYLINEMKFVSNGKMVYHHACSLIKKILETRIVRHSARFLASIFVLPPTLFLVYFRQILNNSEYLLSKFNIDINFSQYLRVDFFYELARTQYLNLHANRPYYDLNMRKIFRSIPFKAPTVSANQQPHPLQNRQRGHALTLMKMFASATSLKPTWFAPQTTVYDGNVVTLTRSTKDLQHPAKFSSTPGSIHYYVDSDYHDFEHFYTPCAKLIYTFDPSRVADSAQNDVSYSFISDTKVKITSPFNCHEHELWNYNHNEINVFRWLPWPTYISYKPEKIKYSNTHSLILLVPEVVLYGHAAAFAAYFFKAKYPSRVNVGSGPFARMHVHNDKEHMVSIARKGGYMSVNLTLRQFETIYNLVNASSMGSTVPKIKTNLDISHETVPILNSYLKSEVNNNDVYNNFRLEYGVINYTITNLPVDNDFKPSLKPFMKPIIHGAFSPSNSHLSNIAAIQGRSTRLHKEIEFTSGHLAIIDKVIKLLIPRPHILHMCDDDEVYAHQIRLTQRNILDEALDLGPSKPFTGCFVKKEAYGNIKDPRIISTLKPQHKLEWSKILYPLATWLKQFPWYAFGKTPVKISEKIADLASSSEFVNCTDFSRMDGRKTILTRIFNNRLLLRLFRPEDAPLINRLCSSDVNTRASMRSKEFEYFFHTLYTWPSGHPLTSAFNSLDNYLITFTGYLNTLTCGGKIPKTKKHYQDAYKLCETKAVLGGDDGAFGDLIPKSIENAATWWGHKLESAVYTRGQSGVNFLSRFYGPDVFNGDSNSMCDLQRVLAKFHTTVDLHGFSPLDKLSQKLTSLQYTDAKTPVISVLLSKYLEVGGIIASRDQRQFQSYWTKYDISDQFPNRLDDWMIDNIPNEFDQNSFNEQVNKFGKPEDFLEFRPCMVILPESKLRAIVDYNGDQMLIGNEKPKHIDSTKVQLGYRIKDSQPVKNQPKVKNGHHRDATKFKKTQSQNQRTKQTKSRNKVNHDSAQNRNSKGVTSRTDDDKGKEVAKRKPPQGKKKTFKRINSKVKATKIQNVDSGRKSENKDK